MKKCLKEKGNKILYKLREDPVEESAKWVKFIVRQTIRVLFNLVCF